ncbi:hypothetical protein ACS2QC_28420 [Bacillus cereus group sp. Bce033]|uniref:hypothetical protein n=1 Tax=unclassified Bacillus cereus group TaxID=2750818 RepID=UPI0026A90734
MFNIGRCPSWTNIKVVMIRNDKVFAEYFAEYFVEYCYTTPLEYGTFYRTVILQAFLLERKQWVTIERYYCKTNSNTTLL